MRWLRWLSLALSGAAIAVAQPAIVRVVVDKNGCVLERNGAPYALKGAGFANDLGPEALAGLHAAGANSIRTWGVVTPEGTRALLDEAQHLGMTVCFGIWIEHQDERINYRDPATVKRILSEVARTVQTYKDDPAVLAWGIGNEMEGYASDAGADPLTWRFIEFLAAAVKKIDPNHPTLTTVAEIGGPKVANLHRYCPDIDIVGINAYAGAASLPVRYRAAGGTKPYLVTEFGPPGAWEVPHASCGSPLEPTSTDKAKYFRETYRATALGDRGLCLGAYAFLWGNKQETTATWYGMLLKDGRRLAAADTMEEFWTGKPPVHPVPRIDRLAWSGRDRVGPDSKLQAVLAVVGEGTEPLEVEWTVRSDDPVVKYGGATEPEQAVVAGVLEASDRGGATVRAPAHAGAYRLFVTIRNRHGGAATGNLPFVVGR